MDIFTIDKATYKRLRKIVDKAQAYWEANATYSKSGWSSLSKELASAKVYAKCTNDVRGLVDQYETLRDLPERFGAYISMDGRDVTTWTGHLLGTARVLSSYRHNYTTIFVYRATIGGRTYAGRGHGAGMCINLRETAESIRKRNHRTLDRVRHKDIEAACSAYNQAFKIKSGERGYLMWADIRGDGHSCRGLYSYSGHGGVGSSDIRKRGDTLRQTKQRIYLAIKFRKLESYCVIIQAIHERGATQQAAVTELARRGLWLSPEQKKQAGL